MQRGARLYLLHQPGPRSFLVAADLPEHRFRVVVGPQTCTCGKGPHCVHLLFVLLRVLKLSDTDSRLFSRTLKDYEVDELMKEYTNQRRRASLPVAAVPKADVVGKGSSAPRSAGSTPHDERQQHDESNSDEGPSCPICLLEMLDGESVVICKGGCCNRLHHHCIAIWAQECRQNGDPVLCPLCRCRWQDEPTSSRPPSPEASLSNASTPPSSSSPPQHFLRPLHSLLRRTSVPSSLPKPPCSHGRANVAPSEAWARLFGGEVTACLASRRWSDRESALREVAAQVGHALRLTEGDPSCLSPWGGCSAIQKACCDILVAGVADPVYKVYIAALRCLRSMLSNCPCRTLEDLRTLQSHVRQVVVAVLFQCADGRNKRSRQLSIAALVEAARGQAGALPVGNLTEYPAPNGLGADFVLDCILGVAEKVASWQGLLGRVMVLQRFVEEFAHLLTSSSAVTGEVNSNTLTALDLALRAVEHNHTTVSRYGKALLVSLAGLCGRCPMAVTRLWDGVAALPAPLRAVLTGRIGRALRDSRGFLATPTNSLERLQEAALVREKLMDGAPRSPSRGARSPAVPLVHQIQTFQLPPPTVDPGGVQEKPRKPTTLRPLLPDKPKPPAQSPLAKKLQSPSVERRLMTSLGSSGRSSGRSSWSSSSSALSLLPSSPPVGRRPDFLPLCRATSVEDGEGRNGKMAAWESHPADCTPSSITPCSVATTPVSFRLELGTPSSPEAAVAPVNTEGTLPQEARVVKPFGPPPKAVEAKASEEPAVEDTVEDEFIVLRPLERLPIQVDEKTRLYTEGEQWLRGPLLGSGAFSSCYQAVDRATGTLLAVKQVSFCRNREEDEDKVMKSVWDEILMMACLDHRNILPLLGATCHGNHYNVFVQWMSGGSVASLLERYGAFSEGVTLRYVHQVLSGLSYLHENHIVHRDLKGANLLVDSTGHHLKIADFGSATKLSSKSTIAGEFQGQLLGTIAFMAPEVLRGENYGRSCDIWSVGCVVIEMATTLAPWDADKVSNYLALTFRIACSTAPPVVPPHLSLPTQNLVLQCLQIRSEDRPTAAQLLSHPCFRHAGIVQDATSGSLDGSDNVIREP